MPEISYTELEKYLKTLSVPPAVCLVYGEEALYKTAFDMILDRLLPPADRSICYEPVDSDNVYEAIERVNTFSLMAGTRVVGLPESRIFYAKQDQGNFAEKAKSACEAGDMKKAARYFTSLLAVCRLSVNDVSDHSGREKNLKLEPEITGDGKWIEQIADYCRDKGLGTGTLQDNAGDLKQAVDKGFPSGNHLVITTDMVDRRSSLYTCIRENGLIVNCTVPKGNTRADKTAQETVLAERMQAILGPSGKRMDRAARQMLHEMTGFDLRTFSGNLEKLVDYVGARQEITAADVEAVLKRTRQDPVYELTGALADRNPEQALFFLDSLLADGMFSLQILAALSNQIRKLLVLKGFAESPEGKKVWRSGMTYNQFQQTVMPAVLQYDQALLSQLEKWENLLSDSENGKGKRKKAKPSSDVVVARNPKSAYPVYLSLIKAGKFTRQELADAVFLLSDADLSLKTGGQSDSRLVLERAILKICEPARTKGRN